MKDRIKALLEHLNVTSAEFADKLGIQRSGVSHILAGRNNPSLDLLQKVMTNYPQINPDWLILGRGRIERGLGGISTDKTDKSAVQESLQQGKNLSQNSELKEVFSPDRKQGNSPEKLIMLYPDGTFRIYIPGK